MARFLTLILGLVVIALPACGDDADSGPGSDPLSAAVDAADRTLAAGSAEARVTVVGPAGEHLLVGAVDFEDGYRLCAEIRDAPDEFQRGQLVWIGERDGIYGTFLSLRRPRGSRCAGSVRWLDDHPPSLSFYPSCPPKCLLRGARSLPIGAEDFVHAALLVLTRLDEAGIRAEPEDRCALGDCYTVRFDFTRFDRRVERDEDLWTLRPLLRSLGRYDAEVRASDEGLIDRVRMAAPNPGDPDPTPSAVAVEIQLSGHGEAPPVPEATATAIE